MDKICITRFMGVTLLGECSPSVLCFLFPGVGRSTNNPLILSYLASATTSSTKPLHCQILSSSSLASIILAYLLTSVSSRLKCVLARSGRIMNVVVSTWTRFPAMTVSFCLPKNHISPLRIGRWSLIHLHLRSHQSVARMQSPKQMSQSALLSFNRTMSSDLRT
jgi:hypothetical protein